MSNNQAVPCPLLQPLYLLGTLGTVCMYSVTPIELKVIDASQFSYQTREFV